MYDAFSRNLSPINIQQTCRPIDHLPFCRLDWVAWFNACPVPAEDAWVRYKPHQRPKGSQSTAVCFFAVVFYSLLRHALGRSAVPEIFLALIICIHTKSHTDDILCYAAAFQLACSQYRFDAIRKHNTTTGKRIQRLREAMRLNCHLFY